MSPGGCGSIFKNEIFKHILFMKFLSPPFEIAQLNATEQAVDQTLELPAMEYRGLEVTWINNRNTSL